MKKIIGILLISALTVSLAHACTDFQIKAKDKTIIIGRSMEFPIDLKSQVVVVPRGQQFNILNKKGIKGLNWTAKYGYIGINAFGLKDCYVEGFNEQGLAFDGLMFTGAVYQPVMEGKYVPLDKFPAWVLGNFTSVAEVKKALADTNIAASEIKEIRDMGMHVALHDAAGQNLVVEFIEGQIKIYDNSLGVMTNRPEFDWQLTNLRNYINLEPNDAKNKKINGVAIEPTGVGSGMLGLPGDFTPPSRFVRVALCVNAALPPKNADEAINLTEHILNVVDIPKGVIKEHPQPLITLYGYAQWIVMKDLTNRVLYFKTYDNASWKMVDLKKFNLQPGTPQYSMAIESRQNLATDVSSSLKP